MARLIRFALAFAVLAGFGAGAHAEPVTTVIAAIGSAVGSATFATVVSYAVLAYSVVSSVYGSMQAKKQARAAAQRKFADDVANLKDRTTTLISTDSPNVVIYGQPAPVGGSIVAALSSGKMDELKHIVMILASHECEAIDDILIDGVSVALDENGYSTLPDYWLTSGIPHTETYGFTVQRYDVSNPQDSSVTSYYYAFVDTPSVNGLTAQIVSVTATDGTDLTGRIGIGIPIQTPGAPRTGEGFTLVGDASMEGVSGTITVQVDGAGSALHITKHLSPGGVDTADTYMRDAVNATFPGMWTDAHKLSGFTYIVITLNLLLDRFQGGEPNVTARVRGKKVYDPRTGATAYSRNPALCLADFLQSEEGYLASMEQVDLNAWVAAANACDQVVYGDGALVDQVNYGNDTRLYVCDGMFRSDQERDTTRQQIEDSMAGYSLESGGVWRILAGSWSTPVIALTGDDLLAPSVVVQTCNPGTSRYNGARGTYVNQGLNGVANDFPAYSNAVFLAADSKEKLMDLALSFTGAQVRTQQIARTMVEQSRGGFILQIMPKMSAWHLQPGDRLVLSDPLFGFTNKTFRVQDWTYSQNSPLAFQVIEDEPSFYDTADEVLADPAPNTNLPSPFLKPDPPLDLAVESGPGQVVQQGGTLIVRAHVSWSQSPASAVLITGKVRVQWRSITPVSDWVTIDLPGDAVETYILGLSVNSEYQVRVQFQTPYASSDWSYVTHTLRGNSEFPADVGGLSLAITATGVIASWAQPTGTDLVEWGATQIRVGDTWEEGIERFTGKATSANIGWLSSGTVKVWAANINTVGAFGIAISTTIDIAAPAQPIVHGEVWSQQIELSWQACDTSQPISAYIVKVGPTLEVATEIGRTSSLKFIKNETAGTRIYWVIAFDAAGNGGDAGYVELTALPTIDDAIAELQDGLDEQIADLLNVNSGISERLLDESIARGTSITQIQNLVTEGNEQLAQQILEVAATTVGYVRANLVLDGGFEFDLDGWTTSIGGWEVVEDAWGASAQLLEGVPADGWISSPSFPVTPGTWYSASGDSTFGSAAGVSGFAIEFFNASGATLGTTSNLKAGAHAFDNGQQRRNDLAVEVAAPSSAASASVQFLWSGLTSGSVGIRYIKGEQGRFPVTPYTSEASDRGAVAAIRQEAVARASADAAEAAERSTLVARMNGAEASIDQESIVRAEQTGSLMARWGLKVTAGNKVAGILLNNDGSESNLTVLVDRFAVAQQTGDVTKYPFVVGSVGGTPTVGIDGSLVVDGSILARSIAVDQLSAITSRLGYVTAGQVDISGDGVGGWGYLRSAGKWFNDGQWGWMFARHTSGETLMECRVGSAGLMFRNSDGYFRLWGPGFNLDASGLTIGTIDVIDTLNIRGSAVTVPTARSEAGATCGITHSVPNAEGQYVTTFIQCTTFVPPGAGGGLGGFLTLNVDGGQIWLGAGLPGTTVTGSAVLALAPGDHSITAVGTAGGSSTALFALSCRR